MSRISMDETSGCLSWLAACCLGSCLFVASVNPNNATSGVVGWRHALVVSACRSLMGGVAAWAPH